MPVNTVRNVLYRRYSGIFAQCKLPRHTTADMFCTPLMMLVVHGMITIVGTVSFDTNVTVHSSYA